MNTLHNAYQTQRGGDAEQDFVEGPAFDVYWKAVGHLEKREKHVCVLGVIGLWSVAVCL